MNDTIVSRDTMRTRGADAFDRGLGVDDHYMNLGAPAIKDWQAGWRQRSFEVHRRQQLGQVSPP